ncbi:MAG: isoprenylcysteine carboxylmethyltransferase family protein [Spirochaetes bacterium]|nr:isoprenylcysteine carboxylmethyltransferase family protein [Spirochaetota bacterium]
MKEEKAPKKYRHTAKDLILMTVEGVCFLAQIVLAFFFHRALGLAWLSYAGWAVFALALLLGWRARIALQKKGEAASSREWLHTAVVVKSGVYGLVRHPIYFSFFLFSLSIVFISQHWLVLLLGVIVMALIYSDMKREEQSCIDKFGDDYKRYMERVPRMNIVLGAIRRLYK